jgi:hypothetical protein
MTKVDIFWIVTHMPPPHKCQSVKLCWKNYRLHFIWDQDAVLRIECLPKDQTTKVEYYSSLLVLLKDILIG